ncbi:uncharacterized protein LOC131846530 isoform X2 [Achroia grisella]|uniref:uncharacterized protein LOC131846530 isoform X2 n=1 Tax=Achroia grisella TaxID=688607 RepID=UPI0027D2EBD0|nr:uncharacterized protein LOC131846530 isoform X2 [Achroia grisella]
MKKCSSIVWRFFDRIENDNKRCIAVLCKLCDVEYKFFGNTTNLRVHLKNKHSLQWELAQNQTLDDSNFRIEDDESNHSTVTPKRKKYSTAYKDKNIDVLEESDVDNDRNEESEATFNLVRQLHEGSGINNPDEEWLEDDQYQTTYEPKRKKLLYKKIKREVRTPPRKVPYRPAKNEKRHVVMDGTSYRDEYTVFGDYVANKLRKFKTPHTRGNLQQLITTMLWQAEYGMYDDANSVKKVLMYSIQDSEAETSLINNIQDEQVIEQDNIPNQINQSIEEQA